MKALLFGSIGTIVETSELQHRAFNLAFEQHGLDWHWDRDSYREMLKTSGGVKRIEGYAASKGTEMDAGAIHATKSALFLDLLENGEARMRPGVLDLLKRAKDEGMALGFVSGTERATIDTITGMLSTAGAPAFDVVTSRAPGLAEKPDPAIYVEALSRLGLDAKQAFAVEDNVDGVAAAKGAGLFVIGTPGAYAEPGDLAAADVVTDDLHAAGSERIAQRAGTS